MVMLSSNPFINPFIKMLKTKDPTLSILGHHGGERIALEGLWGYWLTYRKLSELSAPSNAKINARAWAENYV